MAFLDFLSDGKPIPAGSAPTATTTQTTLPDWYTNYGMDIIARQNAVANTPYATAPMPRVAGLTPTGVAGQNATIDAATAGRGALTTATGATTALLGASALDKASPYFGAAGNMSGLAAAQPDLTTAGNLALHSTTGGGLSAAQPYLTAAGGSSVGNISDYMNPYTDQVVNRIGEVGARTLNEQILPGIRDKFIGAGQYGSSRNAEMFGRGVRDSMESISAEQAKALESGYGTALSASQADLARKAQLAGTAGNLGTAQQDAEQNAAATLANIGTTAGNLTADQQKALESIGVNTGNLAAGDISAQRNTAGALAGLATQRQNMDLTGAGALTQVGNAQQNLEQKSLDTAYADFLRQQGYPQEQIDNMLKTLQTTKTAVPTLTQEAGIVPVNNQGYTPSTGSQIGAGLTGLAGLASTIKDLFN